MYADRKENIQISYLQFRSDIEDLGSCFYSCGYQNRQIAVFGENSYEWILTNFAASCGRGVIVPIDKELDTVIIVELLHDSESKVLV